MSVSEGINALIRRGRDDPKKQGPTFEVDAAIAIRLASLLEDEMYCHACERGGALPKEAAALSKELRTVVDSLSGNLQRDDEDNPFGAALSTVVLDPPQPGPPDTRAGSRKGGGKARGNPNAVAGSGN